MYYTMNVEIRKIAIAIGNNHKKCMIIIFMVLLL